MKIAGLQKVTLIDYPEKIACTIFLYGCNFRCGFCHNPELVIEPVKEIINEKEVLSYLEKKKKYLDGVCITGGEPLLSLDIEFLKKIKELGFKIKIDTNGSFPDKLREIIQAELVDYIAMDIKSSKNKYNWVVGPGFDLEKIEESIKLIAESGVDYEFRTTIVEGIHDVVEAKEIAVWLNELIGKKPRKFVLQGFRNQGKFIDGKYKLVKDVEEEFLLKLKNYIKDYFERIDIRV